MTTCYRRCNFTKTKREKNRDLKNPCYYRFPVITGPVISGVHCTCIHSVFNGEMPHNKNKLHVNVSTVASPENLPPTHRWPIRRSLRSTTTKVWTPRTSSSSRPTQPRPSRGPLPGMTRGPRWWPPPRMLEGAKVLLTLAVSRWTVSDQPPPRSIRPQPAVQGSSEGI